MNNVVAGRGAKDKIQIKLKFSKLTSTGFHGASKRDSSQNGNAALYYTHPLDRAVDTILYKMLIHLMSAAFFLVGAKQDR